MSVGIHGNVGRLVGLLCLALGISTACRGQDVKYNFMPGTDFSKYHTYKWVAIEGASHPNQIMDAEIKQAVDSQLASKGMTKTDGGRPTFTSVIKSLWTRKGNGMPGAPDGASGAVWAQPPVRPSISGL